MARPKKGESKKERIKSVHLSKKAYFALNTIIDEKERIGAKFNLSKWISKKLIEELGVGQERILLNNLQSLQSERDSVDNDYMERIKKAAEELAAYRDTVEPKQDFTDVIPNIYI